MASKLWIFIENIVSPIHFMLISASFLPTTIIHLLRSSQYWVFLSWSAFKDAWFAQFWSVVGPETRLNATPRVAPLLSQAQGVILDIGPGSGEWLQKFDSKKVTRILGVEPNHDHHARLRDRIKAAGLEAIYEIVPVGVEDLGSHWVEKGDVDTIVTIQCLCSVPEPKSMIDHLYGYLKEGGSWIVYEHVATFEHQGKLLGWYQRLIDVVWPTFLGGCSITRDTGRWLREAGAWSQVELKQPHDEVDWNVVPHILGVLTK